MAEKKGQVVDIQKRSKMSRARQQMIAIVLVTAVALGVALVLIMYLIRMIKFNVAAIAAKDEAIVSYEVAIKNVGVCRDTDKDGKYSQEELDKCDPNKFTAEDMPNSLRYSVMVDMANNVDLETVGRDSLDECFDTKTKKKKDFYALYQEAESDSDRIKYFGMMKMCSALRTIPDALPATENTEALMSSLNQIFIESGWEPEALSPSTSVVDDENDPLPNIDKIPVNLAVEGGGDTTMRVLTNIEKSIRTFEVTNASISWDTNGINLRATANAYYTTTAELGEHTETLTMKDVEKKGRKR